MQEENKKTIDYYGDKDNYIHLKWGDCVKMYNFTEDFIEKYPDFVKRYSHYYNNWGSREASRKGIGFSSPFEVVAYVFKKNIPVHFYYNYTDKPAEDYDDIINYLVGENTYIHLDEKK